MASPAQEAAVAKPTPARPFPPKGAWERREPEALGMDRARLDEAVAFAIAHENRNTKDLAADIRNTFRAEAPYNELIGPTRARTGSNGVIVRRGFVAAAWGDTARADMTFSVTKSFLSAVVGVLVDRGLIGDVDGRVADSMPPGVDLFASPHNAKITWDHLLRQTSDWSGTLWGKPDWADRPPRGVPPERWPDRAFHEPGTFFKYNDTRVNVLAFAALHVAKRELPAVLREAIMDPIGASDAWRWEGYANSRVTIDGREMVSVSGGGHFGGGLFIDAFDLARFGYLFLADGVWAGRRLVSDQWISRCRSPGPANPQYGYMNWYLNNPAKRGDGSDGPLPLPSCPRSSVTFRGNGQNIVYLDRDHDLLVVVRWLDGSLDAFLARVLAAIVS